MSAPQPPALSPEQEARVLALLYAQEEALDPAEIAELEREIAQDPAAQAQLAAWREVRGLSAHFSTPPLRPQPHDAILRAARQAPHLDRRGTWWQRLWQLSLSPAFAALALLVVVGGLYFWRGLSEDAGGRFEGSSAEPARSDVAEEAQPKAQAEAQPKAQAEAQPDPAPLAEPRSLKEISEHKPQRPEPEKAAPLAPRLRIQEPLEATDKRDPPVVAQQQGRAAKAPPQMAAERFSPEPPAEAGGLLEASELAEAAPPPPPAAQRKRAPTRRKSTPTRRRAERPAQSSAGPSPFPAASGGGATGRAEAPSAPPKVQATAGMLDDALDLADAEEDEEPSAAAPATLQRARQLRERGQTAAALAAYEVVIAQGGAAGLTAAFEAAVLYEAQGERARARALYTQVAESHAPEAAQARQRRAALDATEP